MSSPYQSPTRRLPAEARLDNGSRIAGDVHLHPNTLAPSGYESALAMINGEESFFPISVEGAGVVLVGKTCTVSMTYAWAEHGEPAPPLDRNRRIPLELMLSDGRTLTGYALADMPSAYPRALDLLNGAGRFVPIRDDAHVHLVNREHVRTVHPLDRP